MNVFGEYARYYDLLYRDKDYLSEVRYVTELLERYCPGGNNILELGCGTGMHANLLAERGFRVHGIDSSDQMLDSAVMRRSSLAPDVAERLEFSHGDLRTVSLGQRFDIVLSLFHVMSYQQTTEDLMAAFSKASEHLLPNGFFVFDCWYGPAVLGNLPSVRVKRLEDEKTMVTRIAEPFMRVQENIVDVSYQVFVRDKSSDSVVEIHESHSMRYLFLPEIRTLFEAAGMRMIFAQEWLTGKEPGMDTWGVCCGGVRG
ncbi:MAG TPA: class I SAM-dependent methyltransferase [Dongiaceae bacterium]|nr:class I SAM-dependent methyltransferase [Dongiaceae bacterium]